MEPKTTMTEDEADRFTAMVDKRGPDECWPWTGAIEKGDGYGRFLFDGARYLAAHRVAWAVANNGGRIPPRSRCVCHTCDNPPCCNPRHLLLRDQLWNIRDRTEKGRTFSKLTPRQVELARRAVSLRTHTIGQLAERFGVHYDTLRAAVHGESWQRLPGAVGKLTGRGRVGPAEEAEISALRGAGWTQRRLADHFGVGLSKVYEVLKSQR